MPFDFFCPGHRLRSSPVEAPTWGYAFQSTCADTLLEGEHANNVRHFDQSDFAEKPFEQEERAPGVTYGSVLAHPQDPSNAYQPAVTGIRTSTRGNSDWRNPGSLPYPGAGRAIDEYPGQYQEVATALVAQAAAQAILPDRSNSLSTSRSNYNRPSSLF